MKRSSILVVDDDPRCVQLVRVILLAAGRRVITAPDGFAALKLVESERLDLVILDVMMPGLDGMEVCRRIREISSVPIIMLTARGEQGDTVEGLSAGADDYIIKPFGAPELLARVEAVLRRADLTATNRTKQAFTDGRLEIDFAHQRALVKGKDVGLTATEYKVLVYLHANAGFVVSSEEVLRKIWGDEYQSDRQLLKVCISRLRKKIEADPRNPRYIHTRTNAGYVFDALPE